MGEPTANGARKSSTEPIGYNESMRKLFVYLLMAFVAIAILFAGFFMTAVNRWLAERRKTRLVTLRSQHQRLGRVVTGLLAKVNEVDQDILYSGADLGDQHSNRFAEACSNLVILSESIPLIEELLEAEEIKKSEEAILKSCRIALNISNDISYVHSVTISLSGQKQVV
jgi:hypothetical protein